MSDIAYFTPDRQLPRTGLIGWGVVLIVLGALTGAISILVIATAMMTASIRSYPPQLLSTLVVSSLTYIVAAVLLIWTGVGSCKGQRWVRPVVMIGSIATFCFGILAVIGTVAGFVFALNANTSIGKSPPTFMLGVFIAAGFEAIILVFLPAALFWFYNRRQTSDVLQVLDLSSRRWTDGVPVPLLGWSVAWFVFGIAHLFSVMTSRTVLFATILHGPIAISAILLAGGLMMLAGWLSYRRSISGWWLGVAIMVFGGLSAAAFAAWGDPTELMQTGVRPTTMPIASESIIRGSEWGGVIFAVLTLVFALYVRRFFKDGIANPLLTQSPEPMHAELG